MFTPIKNLITYIQKNANFGSSTTTTNTAATEESVKMETAGNVKPQNAEINTEGAISKEEAIPAKPGDKEEQESTKETTKNQPTNNDSPTSPRATTKTSSSSASIPTTPLRTSPRKNVSSAAIATTASKTSEFEEDDIETQIESSIMLKKPVKDASSKGTEILEVKKSPDRSIFISHDYNRNQAVTPIDDELEDFRHDPTEVVTSSPLNQTTDMDAADSAANHSVDCAEEAKDSSCENARENNNQLTENEDKAKDVVPEVEECEDIDDDKTQDIIVLSDLSGSDKIAESPEKNTLLDSEMDDDVEEMVETLSSISAEDDVEETFLDLDTFPDSEVIVICENTQENSAILPIDNTDAANTNDDPLAIACEEEEAFAADKISALQELNLLNTGSHSQDEDTTTTTADDDMLWLRNDTTTQRSEQPSCSNKSPAKIPNQSGETPEKDERNGEGSDSGLGSETSALHTTNTSITDTSQLNMTSSVATPAQSPKNSDKDSGGELRQSPSPLKPLRSNLKRRLEVDDDDVVDTLRNITSSTSSTQTTTSSLSDNRNVLSGSVHKKPKRSINFDNVQVYYFPRQQGFSCVPSAGGCTLGMGARHVGFKTLTLAEHAAELRRAHRMQLQEINPRGSSSDDSEESEEDYLSEGSGSDLDGESNGFLQPVSPKQRRTILKAAGIRKIDPSEKAECRDIRNSREVCGCSCRDFCDPETCACSQSGIKCQVDRDMFPCGCSRDACGNTIGRVEFNPARVRTHFIHTLMRLEMENRQQQNPYSPAAVVPTVSATSSSYYQSHLQPQSNYSSGYASPAYNASAEMQHQQQHAANTFYHQQTASGASGLYGQPTSIEMPLGGTSASTSSSVAATTPYVGMDSLDSGLFSSAGAAVATPSYGELLPVSSYHHHTMNYGNVQTQVPGYNTYHSNASSSPSSYINANTTTLNNTPTSYSSCAVPSIPPYGAATTTEATGGYHSVNTLTTMETTTAPSCTKDVEVVGASFISLSTPLASSSRLSQINDLLQHNRNTTTALVAITQPTMDCNTASAVPAATISNSSNTVTHVNGVGTAVLSSSSYSTTSINTPPIEDAHKSCMAYVDLSKPPPLKAAPIMTVVQPQDSVTEKLPAPPPLQPSLSSLTSEMSLSCTPIITTTTTTTTEPMIDLVMPSTASNLNVLPQPEPEQETEMKVELEPEPHEDMDTSTVPATTSLAETTTIETVTVEPETPTLTTVSTVAASEVVSAIEVAVAAGN